MQIMTDSTQQRLAALKNLRKNFARKANNSGVRNSLNGGGSAISKLFDILETERKTEEARRVDPVTGKKKRIKNDKGFAPLFLYYCKRSLKNALENLAKALFFLEEDPAGLPGAAYARRAYLSLKSICFDKFQEALHVQGVSPTTIEKALVLARKIKNFMPMLEEWASCSSQVNGYFFKIPGHQVPAEDLAIYLMKLSGEEA